MRKFIANPALEAEQLARDTADETARQEAAERTALESISLEEEQLLIDEANAAANQSAQDLDETDRISEVSDALEDLAVIAGDMKEPTQNEINLIQNTAQMAVAGTDVCPDEVVPAIESIEDWKNKAADFGASVKRKAKEIWEKIMSFLKRIWATIQEFFYRIVDTIPALQKRLTELAKDLEKAKTAHVKLKSDKMKCNVGAISLSLNGQPVKSSQELIVGLSALNEASAWVFGTYADRVVARGNNMAKVIANFDWGNPSLASTALLEIVSKSHPLPKLPGQQSDQGTAIGGTRLADGPQLLGGLRLVRVEGIAEGFAPYQALSNFQRERVYVERAKQGDIGREFETETLEPSRALTVVKDAQELLKTLETWKRKHRLAMEDVRKALETASNRAAEAGDKVEKTQPKPAEGAAAASISDVTIAQYRQALNFNTAFTRWTRDPAVDLMSSALSSVRGLIFLVRRSMEQYEFDNPATKGADTPRLPAPGAAA